MSKHRAKRATQQIVMFVLLFLWGVMFAVGALAFYFEWGVTWW